jgi:hypothetical protein
MIPRTDLRAQALHVEEAKEKLRHYRRRTPEASTLYQIVYPLQGGPPIAMGVQV